MWLAIWLVAMLVFGFIAGNNTRSEWYHVDRNCFRGIRFCHRFYRRFCR